MAGALLGPGAAVPAPCSRPLGLAQARERHVGRPSEELGCSSEAAWSPAGPVISLSLLPQL